MMPIGDDNSARRSTPVVTYAIIAVNVLVFFLEMSQGDAFVIQWSFVPTRFLADPGGQFITIFSSMFMHAGTLHIFGNMLYLWIFGDNVEDNFGPFKYFLFYLLSGIVATFAQLFVSMNSSIPNLGASGAIAGVLGAYLIMFPRGRVNMLIGRFVTQTSALFAIGIWFLLQLFSSVGSLDPAMAEAGGVAYFAHIGGFIGGLLLSFAFRDSSRLQARV
jgi:membrane associated rhomboid family serine protease